jgi:hypothetical protein
MEHQENNEKKIHPALDGHQLTTAQTTTNQNYAPCKVAPGDGVGSFTISMQL